MTDPAAGGRTTITRLRDRTSTDRAALDRLLDDSVVGHVGLVDGHGLPVVIPTAIVRDGDELLLHGSTGSVWMRRLAAGAPCSVAVTALDALVVARSGFESSINYRSAVLFGTCRKLTGTEHRRAADVFVDGLIPGRLAELREPSTAELAATMVLALPIGQWSLKIGEGFSEDGPDDVAGPAWAGIVPISTTYGTPVPAPDVRDGIDVPDSVRRLS